MSDRIGGHRIMWIAAVGWGASTFLLPDIIRYFSNGDYSIQMIAFARVVNGAFQGKLYISLWYLLLLFDHSNLSIGCRRNAFS